MSRKVLLSMIATLVAMLALSACGSETKAYALDGTVRCLTVYDGANFRTNPSVPGPESNNLAFKVEMSDHLSFASSPTSFTIDTPDGVVVHNEYHNGTWYGIRRGDLAEALEGKLADRVSSGDEESLLWVNKDRAEAKCGA